MVSLRPSLRRSGHSWAAAMTKGWWATPSLRFGGSTTARADAELMRPDFTSSFRRPRNVKLSGPLTVRRAVKLAGLFIPASYWITGVFVRTHVTHSMLERQRAKTPGFREPWGRDVCDPPHIPGQARPRQT